MENEISRTEVYNDEPVCKGKVKGATTLAECENYPYPYQGFAKIPVVLGEFTVQIDVESKIKLCEPAIEIKRIKKNVFLTQCRLIAGTNKLFLKGYVRKNIEYATKDCEYKDAVCGDIKHTTVSVPFECVTKVDFKKYPKLFTTPPSQQVEYVDKKMLGRDKKEQDLISYEYFNEKVYCELEKAYIYEADIVEEEDKYVCDKGEEMFNAFVEKEVIYLTMKLLQKQQIHDFYPDKCEKTKLSPEEQEDLVKVRFK